MRYAVYGDLAARDSIALVTALSAKRIGFDFVAETPALSLALAARAGRDDGPFLRTPEGFIVGDLHDDPRLSRAPPSRARPGGRPRRFGTPARGCSRIGSSSGCRSGRRGPGRCSRRLSKHLETTGFLLGATPCRPDGPLRPGSKRMSSPTRSCASTCRGTRRGCCVMSRRVRSATARSPRPTMRFRSRSSMSCPRSRRTI